MGKHTIDELHSVAGIATECENQNDERTYQKLD